MATNIDQFVDEIKREFGHPLVRVELDDDSIKMRIMQAVNKFIKHATGQSKQEQFFTMPISAGVNSYALPVSVVEVVDFKNFITSPLQINTLFTMGNYMYNQGTFDPVLFGGGGSFNLINYHTALEFIETMGRYFKNEVQWKYNYHLNTIEISPIPQETQFALVHAYLLEGTAFNATEKDYSYFFDKEWVRLYSIALCKRILGETREKFASFNSIGNVGISLNGSSLKAEAAAEIRDLEERLKNEEAWDGMPILMGTF